MKKGLKIISLSIILVLPVLIYLFLRTFGENRYNLPVFPEERVEIEGCGVFDSSYSISLLRCGAAGGTGDTLLLKNIDYLIHFPSGKPEIQSREGNEIRRFLQKTHPLSYSLITFAAPQDTAYWQRLAAMETERDWLVTAKCPNVDQFMNCTLLMALADVRVGAADSRLVLLDRQGRIRGYYEPSDKEEIDRLVIEMDVLNQKPTLIE